MVVGKKRSRVTVVAALVVAGLALVSGKPAWGKNGKGLGNMKPGKHHGTGVGNPSGKSDLVDGDIDYDALTPKDCADYLCVSSSGLATEYIESGCPGQLATYEPLHEDVEVDLAESSVVSIDGSSGVTSGTLLSLAGISGLFAAAAGFLVGYKTSPSFAYMRIPSLVGS